MRICASARAAAAALSVLAVFAVRGEKRPYERYESITERQMFGPLPPDFDPTKPPGEVSASSSGGRQGKELTKEQEKLQSAITFSAINKTPDGTVAVGFTDKSNPKAPAHYYLKVGEERDGWKVEEADLANSTMRISKGEIEVTLGLGGNSGNGSGTSKRGAAAAAKEEEAHSAGSNLLQRRKNRRMEAEAEARRLREAQEAKDAEREAKAAEEKAQVAEERQATQQQLAEIQAELEKVREQNAKAEAEIRKQDAQEDDDAED